MVATELIQITKLKYLPFGLLEKNLANPCSREALSNKIVYDDENVLYHHTAQQGIH